MSTINMHFLLLVPVLRATNLSTCTFKGTKIVTEGFRISHVHTVYKYNMCAACMCSACSMHHSQQCTVCTYFHLCSKCTSVYA